MNIIQAEIDSLLRTPGTDGCKVINGPVTQDTCPKVDRLRQELAASQEVARLEADLVADRGALSEIPVAAFVADPQSAALNRLTGFGEEELRNAIAVLLAFLIELGGALGFSVIILAGRSTEAGSQALSVEENKEPSLRSCERRKDDIQVFPKHRMIWRRTGLWRGSTLSPREQFRLMLPIETFVHGAQRIALRL